MSFLGKFFAGKPDPAREAGAGAKGDDGPPQPKKQVPTEGGAQIQSQAPKKKFEKPSVIHKEDVEHVHQPQEAQEVRNDVISHDDHNGSDQVHHYEPKEEVHENESSSKLDTSTHNAVASTPGKALTFLEKMKLKKQQEAMEKSALETSQVHEQSLPTESSEHHPPQNPEVAKPKFGFLAKSKPANQPQENLDHSQASSILHEGDISHPETQNESNQPQSNAGGSKLPFRFLNKNKKAEAVQSAEYTQHAYEHQNNSKDNLDSSHHVEKTENEESQSDHKKFHYNQDQDQSAPLSSVVESKTTPTKPRFGFLNKPKLQVDQDSSSHQPGSQQDVMQGDNPNENTLNLSPVDKDKSFNVQGDLADTLDRYDSGGITPQVERKQAIEAVDFVNKVKKDVEKVRQQQEAAKAKVLAELFEVLRSLNEKKRSVGTRRSRSRPRGPERATGGQKTRDLGRAGTSNR
jgi:hypothetical protein